MEELQYIVESEDAGRRLDVYLTEKLPDLSRSYIQKLIEKERITVEERIRKSSYKVQEDERILLELPELEELEVSAKDIPIDILYEDEDLVVVNKEKGMVVHPAQGNYHDTLVNALLYHVKDLSGINGILRPGIVHRIDKDTTGILVVAKNDFAHGYLSAQLKDHSMKREYLALVHGNVKTDHGTIDAPLGRSRKDRMKMAIVEDGKRAVTHYDVIRRYQGFTLIRAKLETGRTHQIRVHMASVHHPLVGDYVYGHKKETVKGQLLHAATLGFDTPHKGYMIFRTPVHQEFKEFLMKLHRMEKK
ncbi:MAG: RluA family pseudouridine synthase [Clostridia bacterium]|nr:RluA family pseudouridine synthase [Clostridia bacterium]